MTEEGVETRGTLKYGDPAISYFFAFCASSLVGAALTLTLGCTAACFVPTLLNIEDHTFLEAFAIVLEHQGHSFMLSGLVFGLTYWISVYHFPNLF